MPGVVALPFSDSFCSYLPLCSLHLACCTHIHVLQAYTASGQWALVEQFLLIPCTLEPTAFSSGSGAFRVDVALCQTARNHAEWTQEPPPNDLRVEFGVQTMLL
jgi:hypothetical protein